MALKLTGAVAIVTGANIGIGVEDITEGIEFMVARPRRASIRELRVMPTDQI